MKSAQDGLLVKPDPRYAWVMVFCVFTLSTLSFGALASVSVFLKPLSLEFGWSRGETSLGYTVISMSSAIFGIFWGIVADKFGTRWFRLVAALVMPAVLYLLSEQGSVIHFYGLYFLFGAFGKPQENVRSIKEVKILTDSKKNYIFCVRFLSYSRIQASFQETVPRDIHSRSSEASR